MAMRGFKKKALVPKITIVDVDFFDSVLSYLLDVSYLNGPNA